MPSAQRKRVLCLESQQDASAFFSIWDLYYTLACQKFEPVGLPFPRRAMKTQAQLSSALTGPLPVLRGEEEDQVEEQGLNRETELMSLCERIDPGSITLLKWRKAAGVTVTKSVRRVDIEHATL